MTRLLAALLALLVVAPAASAQTPRVIGGTAVPPGELPWTVALVSAGVTPELGQFCGGTLVQDAGDDRDVVVTAAHCVEGETAASIEVLAGFTTLSDATAADLLAVESIAVLPGTTFPNPSLRGDLAILTLADPATGVEPIGGLPAAGAAPPATLRVAGWGERTTPPTPTAYADTLLSADLDAVTDAACASAWGSGFDVGTMTCALETAPFRDSCNGDSGGPLTDVGPSATDGTGWTLYGAVSFGSDECNDAASPGVYARLSAPALRDFVLRALDADPTNDPVPQPEYASGAPALTGTAAVGETLTCTAGTLLVTGGDAANPVQIALSIVRSGDNVDLGAASHTLTASDAGRRFACRARATVPNGGGSVTRETAATDPVVPAPVVVQVPGPVQTITVPGPAVPVPVPVGTPRVADTAAPGIARVTRTCSKQRRCTFRVTARDAAPSAGVTALSASATTLKARSCRVNRKRTICASVVQRDLRVRRTGDGTFTVTTPRALPRGTHTLVLVAADANGNVQARPYRTAFRVR